uniref:Interferon gamma n=1 Tax=Periophthalmus magnuspinnatus TaxID=409849 RepID=A0A3B4AT27_9GOBI
MDAMGRVVLCVCVLLFMAQVRSSHIPREMNRTLQDLRHHYVRKVFLGGILETYDTLLKKMLEKLPTPGPNMDSPANANSNTGSSDTVRNGLSYILDKVNTLKDKHYQEQEKLLTKLQSLRNITTDDLVVQSKALAELPWLYEEASSLVNNDKRRRRRRQTERAQKQAKVRKG